MRTSNDPTRYKYRTQKRNSKSAPTFFKLAKRGRPNKPMCHVYFHVTHFEGPRGTPSKLFNSKNSYWHRDHRPCGGTLGGTHRTKFGIVRGWRCIVDRRGHKGSVDVQCRSATMRKFVDAQPLQCVPHSRPPTFNNSLSVLCGIGRRVQSETSPLP